MVVESMLLVSVRASKEDPRQLISSQVQILHPRGYELEPLLINSSGPDEELRRCHGEPNRDREEFVGLSKSKLRSKISLPCLPEPSSPCCREHKP
jgi:hypothetical protein